MIPRFSPESPVLALAPMDAYTDAPFRQLVRLANPDALVFTELTSATAITYGSEKSIRRTLFDPIERPFVVQLFGKVPEDFTSAVNALLVSGATPDGIDINFGCPARKVVNSGHGSALIDKPELAAELVRAVRAAFPGSVSIKTRLGIREKHEARPLLEAVAAAGVDFVSIHGRTRSMGYSGEADWAAIAEISRDLGVPVIGNGDLPDAATGLRLAREHGLAGAMIGRATFGAPWVLFSEGGTRFAGFPPPDADASASAASPLQSVAPAGGTPATRDGWISGSAFSHLTRTAGEVRVRFDGEDFVLPLPPRSFADRIPWIRLHARLSAAWHGEGKGIRDLRKHLVAYVSGVPGAARLREKLVHVDTIADVDRAAEILAEA